MGDMIYKYPLTFTMDKTNNFAMAKIEAQGLRKFLDIQYQGNVLTAWFEVDPEDKNWPQTKTFVMWGTGWERKGDAQWKRNLRYLKTVQDPIGFVFHIYGEYF